MSQLIGADQPLGVTRKLSYQMIAERYTGRVLYVTFRTKSDLSRWLPLPLHMENPHEGFLKIYELKRRPENGKPYPPAFSQYHEACVTVLAAPPGEIARHYNLFMWVTHDWAIFKARAAFGWPKKIANINMTSLFASEGRYDNDPGSHQFNVDVDRYGYQIIKVRAVLNLECSPQDTKPFNGFYTVRHIPAPLGEEDIREILVIEPRDGWFGPGIWGEANIEFGDAPDEELSQIGPVTVTGCVLRDTKWILPAWPARKLMTIPPIDTDYGERRPWIV